MFDAPVRKVMKRAVIADPDIPVVDGAKLMRQKKVGALVVMEGERLLGIFTERDVVFRVVAAGKDPKAVTLGKAMTRSPLTIGASDRFGQALVIMHDNGFRHLPVIEAGRVVGIVSARSAADPDLEDFTAEANRREHLRRSVH